MELELIGLVALGFAVGTYGTIIGLGGGFILVPALLLLYPDYDPEQFTAISLAVVFANTTSGSISYRSAVSRSSSHCCCWSWRWWRLGARQEVSGRRLRVPA
jgi:Sulfite exporter TauE/SafE